MEQLFVYGTLRPGGRNHHLLTGAIESAEDAVAEGLGLYPNSSSTFPYAAPTPGQSITGSLCSISVKQWRYTVHHLDLLEGFTPDSPKASHYLRRRWTVRRATAAGTVEAWLYLAGPRASLARDRLITSGDWLAYASSALTRACTEPDHEHVPEGGTPTCADCSA